MRGDFQPMLDLEIEPTAAMREGRQHVYQCAWCGTVVVQSNRPEQGPLGPCPACGIGPADERGGWWHQDWTTSGLAGLRDKAAV